MRWLVRFRVCIIICIAVMLISTAVIFSILRAALPYATGYKAEIQQELSRQTGLPVEINSIDAEIHGFSPRLKLLGVSVYDEKDKVPLFNFKEAFVELDVFASILRAEFIVDNVGLVGADLSIEKLSATQWLIQGIKINSDGESELPAQFTYMLQNSSYLLHDSNIYYRDHTGEKLNFSLLNVNIDVSNSFNKHDIKLSMNLPEEYGRDLVLVASLQGDLDELEGEVYVDASQVNIRQWENKFNILSGYSAAAMVDVNLWITLKDNAVGTLMSEFTADDVSIRNTGTGKSWKTKYLSSAVRYVQDEGHWNITLLDFYFGDQLRPSWGRETTVIASDDEDNYYLSAEFLRLKDVARIAEVFLDKEQLSDLDLLKSHRMAADLYNFNLQLPKDRSEKILLDNLRIDTTVLNLSVQDEKNKIKLSGIDAFIQYDNRQVNIDLNTQDGIVEFKNLFRGPLKAEVLSGNLVLDYDGEAWQLNSERVQIKNDHINAFSRLDIQSTTDDDIFVDIQTDFYDAYGKYARYYLPIGVMSEGLVDWLDMAVTDGYVPEGVFSLYGNLGDFPYENHEGVLQVVFSAQDVNMQFLEGWPSVTDVSATVKFNNRSLFLSDAKGKTHGTSLFNGHAEIINLDKPHLTFTTDAHGKNQDVQSYIWNSELDDIMGNAMRLFQFEGESELNLKLDVPLDEDEMDVKVDGHIKFIDTDIYYSALGYELKGINGTVDFTEDSIFADSMDAVIQGRHTSVNAYTRDAAAGREVVFHLDGVMDADYLLQRYDWIPPSWFSGSSNWAIDVEVPNNPKDYLVHIKTNSYLEDVDIRLSDSVSKPAKTRMQLSTEIDVLDDNGMRVISTATPVGDADTEVDNIFDIFATRDEDNIWHFDIRSEYMSGKGSFSEGLGRDTLVKLDMDNVDVYAMFYTKGKGDSKPLDPALFPPLRWRVDKVLWDGWVFTDVEVDTDWHEHGMLINHYSLKGEAMTFDAHGTWLTNWRGAQETIMEGTITSSNLGTMLTDLGFERSINHSKYKATFTSRWPAEPYGLSWANMTGETHFEMKNGEIVEVDPGAGGRLLGLLNIFKLTNRLALDFDDVTRKGFAFDKIKGDFEFVNGDGSLKDFDVSAPAADINMFGSIGILKRDYGLLMRVKPHTDTLTFAGGALLGGVVIGAGLALIQKVFDLSVIGHNVYSITGSWDDPVIKKIIEKSADDDADVTDEDDF